MEDWIRVLNLMLEKDLYVRSVFGHYRPDATDAFLKRMSSALTQLRFVLRDGNATEFVPVTIPEGMSIEETDRLLASLHRFGVRVRTLVVNRVVSPHQCPFCEARRRDQKPYLDEIRIRFSAWNLVWVPLLPWEVQGQQALTSYAQAMLGHELPSLCSAGEPHNKASKSGGEMRTRPGPASIPWQALARRQLVLFGGKGGVGKTTVAAATAVHLARENAGQKTLLFSVDPAHSLSDNLDQRIGNRITPVAGVQGLSALEMGATDLLEELKREYVAEIGEAFDAFLGGTFDVAFDRRVMEELISLTPPGVDELMALLKVMDWMEEGTFDRYILDLAPTGHALRFLEAPGLVRQWFTAVFRLLLKYKGMVHLDRVAELLCDKSRALRSVERLLIDSERCEFIAVAIPEAMPVLETSRLLPRLSGLSVTSRCVMVNMVMPHSFPRPDPDSPLST
jgi:arsenite-transporting ATPase